MTPVQLTWLVEVLGSLGHSIQGLAKFGVYVAAEQSLIDELMACDHPHAKEVAQRLFLLGDRPIQSAAAEAPTQAPEQ
jgi:hypothetical protein